VGEAQNQVHATFPFMRSSQANKERMRLRDENYTEPATRTHGIYIHTHLRSNYTAAHTPTHTQPLVYAHTLFTQPL